MQDFLFTLYPWVKALHIVAVISWMAGLFYLPRLFVHHTERVEVGSETDALFQMMEQKLLRVIMNPAMIVTWAAGLYMVFLGVIDWGEVWPWLKAICVLAMTWFHHWLGLRRKEFVAGANTRSGKHYRLMNEVPTLLMLVIVVGVVVRPF
jgi:putative membrane protein